MKAIVIFPVPMSSQILDLDVSSQKRKYPNVEP